MQPTLLIIVDRAGWAHDYKTRNLIRVLGSEYDIRLRYQSEVTEADIDEATLVVLYYWLQINGLQSLAPTLKRNRHKLLLGICSSYELDEGRREPGLVVIRDFACGVFINNLALYRQYQPLLNLPTFYTPNGVDTTFYTPDSSTAPSSLLRVGWAGSLTNMGPGYRGFHEFIAPAAAAVEGVKLLTAAREDKLRGPEEMREFYRSLDVYICASRNEGTPNPCLEAAACGVPLLTTPVGNMPELVRHGANGFFVERDVDDIARKLQTLRDDSELRTAMAKQIHEDIQPWDWSLRARAYRQMFEEMIRGTTLGDRVAVKDSAPDNFRVVALMSAYNEEDIIVPCLQYLIKQGVEVYLIDNWSTDSTVELASEFLGKGLLAIEKFPPDRPSSHYVWKDILSRMEQLTKEIPADWFIFHDVDEIRSSPWPGLRLRDAIRKVDREGFNAIDHTLITFFPVDNDFSAGDDFEAYFKHFEFSVRPGQFLEIKAWKNSGKSVSLSNSGGHEIKFAGRRIYPFRFLLKHYPIRSQTHGEKKIFRERKPRWLPQERSNGWHTHYDHIKKGHSFLRQPGELKLFDESAFGELVDWTAAHIKALQPAPDSVLTLVDMELKKKTEAIDSLAVAVLKRKPSRNTMTVDRSFRNTELEAKRVEFNRFATQLAERDKNIHALLKQPDAVESLATQLTESHEILVRLVEQLAPGNGVSGSLKSPLSVLYGKLWSALFSRKKTD